ncbi:RraA family protein [Streptomyces sp. NPDC050433]|uniref:RraA family protein n=1 Tax=Streptomyces sp. NPDC050433 TaxID=3365615 RepID=UPI0037A29641
MTVPADGPAPEPLSRVRTGPAGAPLAPRLAAVLRTLDTAGFGHLLSEGVLTGVRALDSVKALMVGTALPVRISCPDSGPVHLAVDRVRPGDVLVVDCGDDDRYASVGSVIAAMLELRGAAGVVVNGAVTDTARLRAGRLPVFSRAVSPLTTRITGAPGSVNLPLTVAGSRIAPGDIVLGDADGVLVMTPVTAAALAPRVAASAAAEPGYLARFRDGAPLSAMTGADRAAAPTAASTPASGSSSDSPYDHAVGPPAVPPTASGHATTAPEGSRS